VYTQDLQSTVVPEKVLSSFLLEELPADTVVVRVAAPFSSGKDGSVSRVRGFFQRIIGDSSLAWGAMVFWNGLRELYRSKFDLIFGVAPPFTNALVAMLLGWGRARPVVLDLKDD